MVPVFAPPTNEGFDMKLGRRFGAVAAGAVAVAGMAAGVGVASAAPVPVLPTPAQVAPVLPTPAHTQPALVLPTRTQPVRVLPVRPAPVRVLPGQPQFFPGQPGQPGQPGRWQPRLRGPQVNRWLPQVDAGQTERVALRLTGLDRQVCNVKAYVADTRRVDVSYPYGRSAATLAHGSTLTYGEQDRAVLYVEADNARWDYTERLNVTVSYDGCGWNARTQYKQFSVFLPVSS